MNGECRFLEATEHGPACGIGVNFYALGEDCALCKGCPVPALDDTAHCKFLEFYTILGRAGQDRAVRVELGCALSKSGLDDLLECQSCSAFEPMPPGSREAVEGRGAPPRFPVGHP